MKTIFDKSTRDELIRRIYMLNENSRPQWGKMNAYQAIKHCRLWEEMAQGKTKYKRVFIGRLFGKMALKRILKDENPLARNAPSISALIIKENGNLLTERAKWIERVEEYAHFSNTIFEHPFFGGISKEQTGYIAYKHIDHHLRQFNC
jgi:hypothetical protein